MRSRQDFLTDDRYAVYLREYATIHAMAGLLADSRMHNGKKDPAALAQEALANAEEVLKVLYQPGK